MLLSSSDSAGDVSAQQHGSAWMLQDTSGVLAEIWESIHGISAGGEVHEVVIGNPLRASGPFYDPLMSGREGWHTIMISAFDTPNLAGLTPEMLLALQRKSWTTTRGLPDHQALGERTIARMGTGSSTVGFARDGQFPASIRRRVVFAHLARRSESTYRR